MPRRFRAPRAYIVSVEVPTDTLDIVAVRCRMRENASQAYHLGPDEPREGHETNNGLVPLPHIQNI